MNVTVYLETTVIGHITARPRKDVTVAARQLASRNWWNERERFSLFISQVVLDECLAGDSSAATERFQLISSLPVLEVTADSKSLAAALMRFQGVPQSEPRDAMHIAIAATHGLQYLLTWNFKHIANAQTRTLIERICRHEGFTPPTICSPDELLGA